MKILIKFPTRGRRNKFFTVLNRYHTYAKNINNLQFLVSIDEDDAVMNNPESLKILESFRNTRFTIGKSESKIHAINRDIPVTGDWDILFLASDDMIPQIKGYDDVIINDMKKYYPDTDGVLWYNDGFQGNKLNTLCILGKKYFQRFNYIYYPGYRSLWSDNEFMTVANILQKQKYFESVIIKHEHFDWGFGKPDEIHYRNIKDKNHDMSLFKERERFNFGL